MTNEELSHLLCSASSYADAASHLLLLPDHRGEAIEAIKMSIELASFALEMGTPLEVR